ncbi:MAG: RNA methyltransferase [Zoogloeaceae bacterium]|nr:RNA methyltransferase [Zoogloeaceae bacterium]
MSRTILSRENPDFRHWKKLLHSARERRKAGLLVLEGVHLVRDWHTAYGAPESVLVSDRGMENAEIRACLAESCVGAKMVRLAEARFAELATTATPAGILALAPLPTRGSSPAPDRDSLLLDGIQDPGNLGTLLRTAAAAGIGQVLLSADCADVWSPKTLRAGQGAHFCLDIHAGADLVAFLRNFQGEGLATALTERAESLYAIQWRHPVAWVFGAEGQGVRPEILTAARKQVRIPMPGRMESLNVSAAAAICLFEMTRRAETTRTA